MENPNAGPSMCEKHLQVYGISSARMCAARESGRPEEVGRRQVLNDASDDGKRVGGVCGNVQ